MVDPTRRRTLNRAVIARNTGSATSLRKRWTSDTRAMISGTPKSGASANADRHQQRSGADARRASLLRPDAGRKLSRFWVLLVLAAIIATAGVIARLDCNGDRGDDRRAADDADPRHGAPVVARRRANLVRSLALVVAAPRL